MFEEDEREAKIVEKEEARQERQLALDYEATFNTPHGERVFNDIIAQCMVFAEIMTGNSWTYHNTGKRAIGLWIMEKRYMANFEMTKEKNRLEREKEEREKKKKK